MRSRRKVATGRVILLILFLMVVGGWAKMCFSQQVYLVQPGDTLWAIAQRFGTTVQALVCANKIENPDVILPGQELIIPISEPGIVLVSTRPTWSLWDIAQSCGMDLNDFLTLNGLENENPYHNFTKADVQRIPVVKVRPYSSFNFIWVSWYGEETQGIMANGKLFDPNDATICAHRWLPFGTRVCLTSLDTGFSIIVVVKDRGPYVDLQHRHFDLSRAAAELLGIKDLGVALCRVEVLTDPEP